MNLFRRIWQWWQNRPEVVEQGPDPAPTPSTLYDSLQIEESINKSGKKK